MEIKFIPPPISNFNNWTLPQNHYSLYHELGNDNNNVEVVALYDYVKDKITRHTFLLSNRSEGIEIIWKGNPFKLN